MVDAIVMQQETITLPRLPRYFSWRGSARVVPNTAAESSGIAFNIPTREGYSSQPHICGTSAGNHWSRLPSRHDQQLCYRGDTYRMSRDQRFFRCSHHRSLYKVQTPDIPLGEVLKCDHGPLTCGIPLIVPLLALQWTCQPVLEWRLRPLTSESNPGSYLPDWQ